MQVTDKKLGQYHSQVLPYFLMLLHIITLDPLLEVLTICLAQLRRRYALSSSTKMALLNIYFQIIPKAELPIAIYLLPLHEIMKLNPRPLKKLLVMLVLHRTCCKW
jgi:hypothetical protein